MDFQGNIGLLEGLQVEKAWLQGYTGCNVSVVAVDDGSYYYS